MVIGTLPDRPQGLGIHTELFCQSHVDLIEAGCVTNTHKGLYEGVSVGTFALGDRRLYRLAGGEPRRSPCCRSRRSTPSRYWPGSGR